MKKWLNLLKLIAPFVLMTVPGIPAALIPFVIHGMTTAEQIKGATGADKKRVVLELVTTGLQGVNAATGTTTVDTAGITAAVSQGIDATVSVVNVVNEAKRPKAPQ